MPLLRNQLETRIDEDRFQALQSHHGEAVLTYQELFPFFKVVHKVDFEHKEDFIDTVCHSSAFPFLPLTGLLHWTDMLQIQRQSLWVNKQFLFKSLNW